MIRLVHFLPSLDTGGAPINVMRVIKWHKKNNAKIQHIVCSPFNNLKMQKLFLKLGTDLIEMPDIKNYLQLLRFIIKNLFLLKCNSSNKTLAILHGRGCGLLIKPLLTLLNYETVLFFRGYTPTYGLQNKFYAFIIRQYDKILAKFGTCVAVGEDEITIISKFLKPKKILKIRNPVPQINWDYNKTDFKYDFGFVGRRSYQKGFDRALRISEENTNKKFVWIGNIEGLQFSGVSIPKNLHIINYLPQEEIFNIVKVLICLSRWEGCSTIISESIQSKKPFLSLHCPGK